MAIKVACIEPDAHLGKMLVDYLSNCTDFDFLGACSSVEEFKKQSNFLAEPDVVLQSMYLDGVDSMADVREVKECFPNTEIIFFTQGDYPDQIFDAIRAGASGYVVKGASYDEIKETIFMIYNGEAEMTPSIARKVKAHFEKINPQ